MPMRSSVHQRFSADQCHAYIPTLRWNERPLQGPRGHSADVGSWGTYHDRPGGKRDGCHGCRRTVNDLTNTLLAQRQRSRGHWRRVTFVGCLSCASRRMARALDGPLRTSARGGWW